MSEVHCANSLVLVVDVDSVRPRRFEFTTRWRSRPEVGNENHRLVLEVSRIWATAGVRAIGHVDTDGLKRGMKLTHTGDLFRFRLGKACLDEFAT